MRKGAKSDQAKLPDTSPAGGVQELIASVPLPPLPAELQPTSEPLQPPEGLKINRSAIKPQTKNIDEDIKESLPAGIELHRSYRYQIPFLRDTCDLVVLKLNVPEYLEHKLAEWRVAIGERHPTTNIFIKRAVVDQNLQNNLLNKFKNASLIQSDGLPIIQSMIDTLCGTEPDPMIQPRTKRPARENFTAVPFIGIDRPGTSDQEDLIHGERKANGSLILRTAFIDITDEILPGSERDKFGQKVGLTLYGRLRTISPLGSILSRNGASFKQGEMRPAWIVECRISPFKESSEYFKIRRAWVVNHADVDPSRPFDPNSNQEIAKNLSALAEITRVLEHRRNLRSSFIRIDGQGAASRIVAETMIHSKRLLARFLSKHSPTGAIYRVHQKPSATMIGESVRELAALKIYAAPNTFESPVGFMSVLGALEKNGSQRAHILANRLLDLTLFRTKFSTENLGHFGLGGIEYLEVKPRAGGIPTQFILDAVFTGNTPPSKAELNRRAEALNEKRWTRDERMYKLRFLEMLGMRLADIGGTFFAKVARVGSGPIYCQIETFSKWGLVRNPAIHHLAPGDIVLLKLEGFNPKEMRFEFSLVDS